MENREKFGKYIKELRESRKLTQEELSKFSNVTFATINRIEKGRANPTLETITNIFKVFGLELYGRKVNHTDD